jgi:hypothetical protein
VPAGHNLARVSRQLASKWPVLDTAWDRTARVIGLRGRPRLNASSNDTSGSVHGGSAHGGSENGRSNGDKEITIVVGGDNDARSLDRTSGNWALDVLHE